jgi:hypothetical protein
MLRVLRQAAGVAGAAPLTAMAPAGVRRVPAAAVSLRSMSASPGPITIDASSLKGRHLDTLASLSTTELKTLLAMSVALKERMKRPGYVYQPLVSWPVNWRSGGRHWQAAGPGAGSGRHGVAWAQLRRVRE